MKTKEFISKAKGLGWGINKTASNIELIELINPAKSVMASVSEVIRNLFETNYHNTVVVDDETLDLIVAYARTPIEERKEPEKKYFVKVLPGEYGYLYLKRINSCEDSSKYYSTTAKLHNATNVKATFTTKELADMREQEDLAIDWSRVFLELDV